MNIALNRDAFFIGGQWKSPQPGAASIDVIEAATEKVIGTAPAAAAADVDAAVNAAGAALNGPWSNTSGSDRADAMRRMAASMAERAQATATLVSRENGMPIALSKGANGQFPPFMLNYYAGLAEGLDDTDSRAGVMSDVLVRREPIGVVAAIAPWNYPMALAAMKIAPALAAGCSVVLKPPPETALDAFVWAEAAAEAGLPAGVLNVIPGDRDAGAQLVAHPGVDKVSFTGSTLAGRAVGEVCGRLLRPVTLELGGKSAAILTNDVDLDVFLTALPGVCLPNNGQTCHASTRILVPQSRYTEIVDAVTDTVRGLRTGDPLDDTVAVGPLVSAVQRDRVLGYIEDGHAGGARLTTGGGAPNAESVGWFVEPTVFADVNNSMRIAREEIFGPVLCVVPYKDIDDAVAIANDSEYGLAGTVWTTDADHGAQVAARIQTGTVGINHYALDVVAPFGGVKASGLGYEMGPEGLAPYLTLKSVYLPPSQSLPR